MPRKVYNFSDRPIVCLALHSLQHDIRTYIWSPVHCWCLCSTEIHRRCNHVEIHCNQRQRFFYLHPQCRPQPECLDLCFASLPKMPSPWNNHPIRYIRNAFSLENPCFSLLLQRNLIKIRYRIILMHRFNEPFLWDTVNAMLTSKHTKNSCQEYARKIAHISNNSIVKLQMATLVFLTACLCVKFAIQILRVCNINS